MGKMLIYFRLFTFSIFMLFATAACAENNRGGPSLLPTPVYTSDHLSTSVDISSGSGKQDESAEVPLHQPATIDVPSGQYFDCVVNARENATIAFTSGTSIDGDLVLEPGDEIAIFTPNGNICAGAAIWTGENIAITAWGDDSQTAEIDGLVNGDQMLFRIWDASEQIAYQATGVDYQEGDGIFVEDGIYIVAALTVEKQ